MAKLEDVIRRGTNAARPAATAVPIGSLYYDTTNSSLARSSGTAWESVEGAAGLADQGTATYLDFTTAAAPANPAAGKIRLYSKTGDTFAQRTSGGTETVFGAGGGGGTDPWLVLIDMLAGSTGHTNWNTINVQSQIHNADVESSGAQNDEIYWHVGVSAGTWTFRLLHYKGPNRGIYHVRVDDVDVGTIDGYVATAVTNQFSEVTGVSISGGKRKVALKMASKNASSSSYFGTATTLLLIRTA